MRSLILTSLLILSQAGAAQSANTDALMFRSIFATVVDPSGSNQKKVDHLIYAPVPELLSASDRSFITNSLACDTSTLAVHPGELIARKALCQMQKEYAKADARVFFNNGRAGSQLRADLAELTKNLQKEDLLIVVVPGVFGEFIKGRAFEEVFERDSAYAREFKAKLEGQTRAMVGSKENCERANPLIPVCDVQEQLSRLTLEEGNTGAKNISMGELLNVGSIDDDFGRPTAKVILFQMDGMTLESLGLQKDKAEIFNRRLKKFLQIMQKTPKNIAFVGYSRGTAFALEMLAQAKSANESWLPNVKAVVSLGGVVLGSALADDVLNNEKSAQHCQLELADMLLKSLVPVPDLSKKPYEKPNSDVLIPNLAAWQRFLVANARFASGKFTCEQVKDLRVERIDKDEVKFMVQFLIKTLFKPNHTDPDFGRKMIMSQAVKFGLLDSETSVDLMGFLSFAGRVVTCMGNKEPVVCLKEFTPDSTKYNTDILRFRRLVEAAKQAVTELTTDSRLNWFRTHTIPTKGIRYYSVSGTMADEKSELVNNRYGYNPNSPDDNGLIQNWKDFTKVLVGGEYAGVNLNDSQVAIYKTAFWPNIIASLNPANAGIRYTPLAVVGTHHWGMALPIVAEVRSRPPGLESPLKRNPFPRAQLMYSIALSIANDIRVDAEKGE